VDGKQARRTGSSSPLGQLFDHGKINSEISNIGCDAVCVFFGLVSFMQATTSGMTWMGLAVGFSLTVIDLICI
jgi:phosphatidylglycerophosphate synthase